MKVLGWYIDPNDIKSKNISKYPYSMCIIEIEIPHHIYPSGMKNKLHKLNTDYDPLQPLTCVLSKQLHVSVLAVCGLCS